jgi:arylsulfatase A-like enzyme/uncharacterized membrane protein YbhN (UPF0104 family)
MSEAETKGPEASETPPVKFGWTRKKVILAVVKVMVSAALLAYVFQSLVSKDGFHEAADRLGNMNWGFWALAVAMQLLMIGAGMTRWKILLKGQGIRPSWRFLGQSFFIGRFFGMAGGGVGLDGWRLYDIWDRTGKLARPTAVFGVEKILGQLGYAAAVCIGSVWGLSLIGWQGVLAVNAFFLVIVTTGMTLLARPQLFRWLSGFLPNAIRVRVRTLIDAVCEYQGRFGLLAQGALLSAFIHCCHNLIYVCAARAVGVELSAGVIFFGSAIHIMATLVPSFNGVGLREVTVIALYTSASVGLSEAEALALVWAGFAAEMFVSAFGAIPFLMRKRGPRPDIAVDDPDRERVAHEAIPVVPREEWPKPLRGLTIGLGAGLLAGVLVGVVEALVIVTSAGGQVSLRVLSYGAGSYALVCMIGGAAMGLAFAWSGRLMKRKAMSEAPAYARMTAFMVAALALVIGAFRIRRDVFDEELVWKSLPGAAVGLGCLVASVVIYLALSTSLKWLLARKPTSFLLRAWGSPAVVGAIVLATALIALLVGNPAGAAPGHARPTAGPRAGNILFIVVDTLRADHLPAYGYTNGRTPNLDAFAQDAVRFDQAYANASWTRPSFASMLTGRYASSHSTMLKDDGLPNELVTLPEALRDGGYSTTGFVTNFNVAPYYNFQQGFDRYEYLEPEFVLGADDASAKLILVQVVRQYVIEKWRAYFDIVEPGTTYRDAETVNQHVGQWLDHAPADRPWFAFVAYMDPHDPYYEHPYNGRGYARAAHQHPDLDEAPELRRLYDGEITYWDEHFGNLVADLKRRGLYDDLTIVITADHGEEFGDHGGFWHGTTLYDEQLHVPLFVKLPGNARGGTPVGHWVQSIDLMPTLLMRNGIEVPEGVQGTDAFTGSDRLYAEENHEGNVLEAVRERRGLDEFKLILANEGNPRGLEPAELYRVDRDRAEQNDLATTDTEELHRLADVRDEMSAHARRGAVQRQTVEVDAQSRERLQAIGYDTTEEAAMNEPAMNEPAMNEPAPAMTEP